MIGIKGLKIAGVVLIVFQVWFTFMYGYIYHYNSTFNAKLVDTEGLFIAIGLSILLLLGFGLVSTYVHNFATTGIILTFFIMTLTLQYYFIVQSFWTKIGLTSTENISSLKQPSYSVLGLSNRDDRISSSMITSVSIHQAIACALALTIGLLAVHGRTGPFETFWLVIIGAFFYAFNEAIFWRLAISDAGFCSRIFTFGSSLGIISSLILGKRDLASQNQNYHSSKTYQTFGLIGTLFVWIFIPCLSTVNQFQDRTSYIHVGPINIWFSLCSSTMVAFCVSILINRKISVHDIVYSSFSGAIAFGASSDILTNSFPPLLIGTVAGAVTALLNGLIKKKLNQKTVIDSHGVILSYLAPAIIGSIFSSILSAIGPISPGNDGKNILIEGRSQHGQGGMQLIGIFLSILIGSLAGSLVGLLYKLFNGYHEEKENEFNDSTFLKFDAVGQQKTMRNNGSELAMLELDNATSSR